MAIRNAVVLALLLVACDDDERQCQRPGGDELELQVAFRESAYCAGAIESGRVIESAAQWDQVRALLDCVAAPALGEVDFAVERLVVLTASASSTCAMSFVDDLARKTRDGIYVELTVRDASAGCELACAAVGGMVSVVRVPRALGTITACTEVLPGCS